MPSLWGGRNWKLVEQRRREYAAKLKAKGVIEGSNKWRKLMCRLR